jgi:hypothetical protein
MLDNRNEYEKYLAVTYGSSFPSLTFDDYCEAMKNPLENGGQLEIAVMSKLYKYLVFFTIFFN